MPAEISFAESQVSIYHRTAALDLATTKLLGDVQQWGQMHCASTTPHLDQWIMRVYCLHLYFSSVKIELPSHSARREHSIYSIQTHNIVLLYRIYTEMCIF